MQFSRSFLGQERSQGPRHLVMDKVALSLGTSNSEVPSFAINTPLAQDTLPLNHPLNQPVGITRPEER